MAVYGCFCLVAVIGYVVYGRVFNLVGFVWLCVFVWGFVLLWGVCWGCGVYVKGIGWGLFLK